MQFGFRRARSQRRRAARALTILILCLNEAETIGACIVKAAAFLAESGVSGEVLISDNGSTDGSQQIARMHGARVVEQTAMRGYGAALGAGIAAARGRYVIMGDADDSYDLRTLSAFLDQLEAGADLVMGNRFRGGIDRDAMPLLHRYLGNPVLTAIGRLLFGAPVRDFHCGLRGFNRQSVLDLHLQTTGMEFASEMVVHASLAGLRIAEAPTTPKKDGRNRLPHLRTWRDGWRHLRFLLLHSTRISIAGDASDIDHHGQRRPYRKRSRAPFPRRLARRCVSLASVNARVRPDGPGSARRRTRERPNRSR